MTKGLPCLLVRQPYASLIAYGKKRWELRSYDTKKRGYILIAASRSGPVETSDKELNKAAKCFPRGMLLASAHLKDSTRITGYDVLRRADSAVTVRIGEFEFLTADAPLGEPLQDLQEVLPSTSCFAWHLEEVKPLSDPIPITTRPCSPWAVVHTEQPPYRRISRD